MKKLLYLFLCLLLFIYSFSFASEPFHFYSADSTHRPLSIFSDSHGGVFVAFLKKLDNGNNNVYLKHYDSAGQVLWGGEEKLIVENIDIIYGIFNIAADINGELFCSWMENQPGRQTTFIKVAKIDANGINIWGGQGISTLTTHVNQEAPYLITDRMGGCYIFWHGKRIWEAPEGIYIQHFNAAGKPLWNGETTIFNEAPQMIDFPVAIIDKNNNLVMAWGDYRNDTTGRQKQRDIFAQCIDTTGKKLWGENGIQIVSAQYDQLPHSMIQENNGRYLLAWDDYRVLNERHCYIQEFGSDGKISWKKEGVKIPNTDGYDDIKPLLFQRKKDGVIYAAYFGIPGDLYTNLIKTLQIIPGNKSVSFGNKPIYITNQLNIMDQNPGGNLCTNIMLDQNDGLVYFWTRDAYKPNEAWGRTRDVFNRYISSDDWLTYSILVPEVYQTKGINKHLYTFDGTGHNIWFIWKEFSADPPGYLGKLIDTATLK